MTGPAPTDAEAAADDRIWRLDPIGLAAIGRAHPLCWAGSVQADLHAAGPDPDLSARPGPFPAYTACAAVIMARNEADIIGINLAQLYDGGLRRFVVMDNMSSDATWEAVQRFGSTHADAELLAIDDPIEAYVQARKTSGMCHLARNVWPDVQWLFPVDADELLITRHGLRALVYVPEHVLAITLPKVVHFRPFPFEPAREPPFPAGMTLRSSLFAVPPKVALRARPELDVSQGNHRAVLPGDGRVTYTGGFQYGFFYREFQTRSFGQFLAKVRHGGAAVRIARRTGQAGGGDHWLEWLSLLESGGEDALRAEYERAAYRAPGAPYVADDFTPPATPAS